MRKLFVLLAVCTMAVSAVAADITFTVTQNADATFTIGYSATSAAAVPVGMGIKVSLTDAKVLNGAAATANSFFDVFLDYASEDPDTYVIGAGHPIADPCAAGVPTFGTGISEFSICLGALSPDTAAPQTMANLITIAVDCEAAFDVAISADALRGGIVGADFDNVYFVGATDLTCSSVIPWTGPACWLSPTQCRGDANGDGVVNTVDWPAFRDGFTKAYPNAAYLANVCGDYNQDGVINTVDWPAFRDNFTKSVAADCVQPQGTWPPL